MARGRRVVKSDSLFFMVFGPRGLVGIQNVTLTEVFRTRVNWDRLDLSGEQTSVLPSCAIQGLLDRLLNVALHRARVA